MWKTWRKWGEGSQKNVDCLDPMISIHNNSQLSVLVMTIACQSASGSTASAQIFEISKQTMTLFLLTNSSTSCDLTHQQTPQSKSSTNKSTKKNSSTPSKIINHLAEFLQSFPNF